METGPAILGCPLFNPHDFPCDDQYKQTSSAVDIAKLFLSHPFDPERIMTKHVLLGLGLYGWMMTMCWNAAAAEPEDRYGWLEEVTSDKSLTWANAAERGDRWRASRNRWLQGTRSTSVKHSRLRREDPAGPQDRRPLLQFLARCQEPSRPLAADLIGRIPQGGARTGKWSSTWTRWRRPKVRTGSGMAPTSSSPKTACA